MDFRSMHLLVTKAAAIASIAILTAACGDEKSPTTPSGFGTVNGLVLANDAKTPIPGAVVQLASKPVNGPIDTTDAAGAYTLTNVPAGNQQLRAERGVFVATFTVGVRANETVTAPAAKLVSS